MLHQPTIEKLLAMRPEPMVETWRSFEQDEAAQQTQFRGNQTRSTILTWQLPVGFSPEP